MINDTQCPICQNTSLQAVFAATDYTVTNQQFDIVKCTTCSLLFTKNVPAQHEIGKYYQSDNYISHSDTQKGLVNSLYHWVRKYTLTSKCNLISTHTKLNAGNILDIGCGTGAFLNAIKQVGWQVTGLEPDEATRKKAASLYHLNPLPSHQIYELPENEYDAITLWHVLEHVHELQDYIIQIKKMLSAKGKIFIAVPNYTSYDAGYYKNYWAAYDVPRHLYHFSPKSMETLLLQHGLVIKKIKPMWFDAFYVSLLSGQYKKDKLNFVKAFLIGFISNVKSIFNPSRCSSLIYIIEKK